jgi:hypothetical protein
LTLYAAFVVGETIAELRSSSTDLRFGVYAPPDLD